MISTTYTIQMASKLSGVGVHTIRAWEKRYKALEPSRDASGHRVYSKTDVEKLILLSELCLLGYTISKVAALGIPDLKDLLKDLGKSEESLVNNEFNLVRESQNSFDLTQSLPILTFAFNSYKLDIVSLELEKLKVALSARDFALQVLLPLGEILSNHQSSGVFSSHQVNALRSLLKFHSGFNLYHPAAIKDKKPERVIVTGMEGDMHDLQLGAVGLLCSHYGFQYTYLGPDMNHEAISDVVKSTQANIVILGPTNVYAQLGKEHFQNFVEKLTSRLTPETELIVAGKSELDFSKINFKRLSALKTLDAVDNYLSNKNG